MKKHIDNVKSARMFCDETEPQFENVSMFKCCSERYFDVARVFINVLIREKLLNNFDKMSIEKTPIKPVWWHSSKSIIVFKLSFAVQMGLLFDDFYFRTKIHLTVIKFQLNFM